MSLCYTRPEFIECPSCRAKPGAVALCPECLERRELWYLVNRLRQGVNQYANVVKICPTCLGVPKIDCPEHGR